MCFLTLSISVALSWGRSNAMHAAASVAADAQALTEEGYNVIVGQHNEEAMRTFIQRLIANESREPIDVDAVSEFVNKHTGAFAAKSFAQLRKELKSALWEGMPFFAMPLTPIGAVTNVATAIAVPEHFGNSTINLFRPTAVEGNATTKVITEGVFAAVREGRAMENATSKERDAMVNAGNVTANSATNLSADATHVGTSTALKSSDGASRRIDVTEQDTLPILKALADVENEVSAQSDKSASHSKHSKPINAIAQTHTTRDTYPKEAHPEGRAMPRLHAAENNAAKRTQKLQKAKGKEKSAKRARIEAATKLREAEELVKKSESMKQKATDGLRVAHLTKPQLAAKMKKARKDVKLEAKRNSTVGQASDRGTSPSLDTSLRQAERKIDAESRQTAMKTAEQQVRAQVAVSTQVAKERLSDAAHELEKARGARMKADAALKEAAKKEHDMHVKSEAALYASRKANKTRKEAFREVKKKSALVLRLQEKERELMQARDKVVAEYHEAKAAWLKMSRALNETIAAKEAAALAAFERKGAPADLPLGSAQSPALPNLERLTTNGTMSVKSEAVAATLTSKGTPSNTSTSSVTSLARQVFELATRGFRKNISAAAL